MVDKFGEDKVINTVLKTCHQTIISRVLHRLKDTFINHKVDMQIKDFRGGWSIMIILEKDRDGNITKLSCKHSRKEIVYERVEDEVDLKECFVFAWDYIHHFDVKTLNISSVEMNLVDIFNLKEEYKEKAKMLRQAFINCMNNVDHPFEKDPLKEEETTSYKGLFLKSVVTLVLVFGLVKLSSLVIKS